VFFLLFGPILFQKTDIHI